MRRNHWPMWAAPLFCALAVACNDISIYLTVTEVATATATATGSGGSIGSGGNVGGAGSGSAGGTLSGGTAGATNSGGSGASSGGSGGSGGQAPFDPQSVQALVDGAWYIPGQGVEAIPASDDRYWHSLAAVDNPAWDGESGYKPVLAMAPNGAPYWDMTAQGPYVSWTVQSPGAAYQWTNEGSYAAWVLIDAPSTAAVVFFAQWSELAAPQNRVFAQKNIDLTRAAVYGSHNGFSLDNAAGQGGIGDRWKFNTAWAPGDPPTIDWSGWHFIRITVDMSKPNRTCGAALCSDRVLFCVDEICFPDGPYSAPQSEYGGAPPDGPVRPLFASTWPFSWGAHGVSSSVDGLGSCWVANGHVDVALWPEIMAYGAPN